MLLDSMKLGVLQFDVLGYVTAPTVSPFEEVGRAALLICLAELGDKSFFIAMLLAAKHNAVLVFAGSLLGLFCSTVLAALAGHLLSSVLNLALLEVCAGLLFLCVACGLLLQYAHQQECVDAAEQEAQQSILTSASIDAEVGKDAAAAAAGLSAYGSAGGTAAPEKGLEQVTSHQQVGLPPTSPSCSGLTSPSYSGPISVLSLAASMSFFGEMGDKSQLLVMAQASRRSALLVTIGSLVGFAFVTGLAVLSGKAVANRLSRQLLGLVAGVGFALFGASTIWEGYMAYAGGSGDSSTAPRVTP